MYILSGMEEQEDNIYIYSVRNGKTSGKYILSGMEEQEDNNILSGMEKQEDNTYSVRNS